MVAPVLVAPVLVAPVLIALVLPLLELLALVLVAPVLLAMCYKHQFKKHIVSGTVCYNISHMSIGHSATVLLCPKISTGHEKLALTILDISQLRHPRRWCTFFKPVYFFPQGTRKGLL